MFVASLVGEGISVRLTLVIKRRERERERRVTLDVVYNTVTGLVSS